VQREALVAGEAGDSGLAAAPPRVGVTAVPVGACLVAVTLTTTCPGTKIKLHIILPFQFINYNKIVRHRS
jgi:hypothetical protein